MVRIRAAVPEDRGAITAVHVASVRGVDHSAYDDETLAVWASGAASTAYGIEEPETFVLVAEREGDLAGFAEASVDAAELDKLYVDPVHQHRGVATSLSEAVDERLRSRGVDNLYVEASPNAVPFYERVGFERFGTHRKTMRVDGDVVEMTIVDMEKSLR